jgi:lipopolysaccharide/colanic/teichoic acid biosynthesis glycosyltransferase
MQTFVNAKRTIDLGENTPIPLDDQPPEARTLQQLEPLLWRRVIKRALDLVGAVAGLVIFSPVFALVAAAVKLTSPGPVLYRQERVGLAGRPFTIYKFRSMVQEAEAAGPTWSAGMGDPRLTRIGAMLRATHLDELPQFWNVLKGDMSLVGPRPERPCFSGKLEACIPGYQERCWAKPGMTGLAQVHYRYDTTVEDVKRKLRFDRLYVRRMCLTLDLQILAWTVGVVLARRGH